MSDNHGMFSRAAEPAERRATYTARSAPQSLRVAAKHIAAKPVAAQRPGVVLLAVLLVVSILALAAYEYADSMGKEYKAADRLVRAAQARAAAASGIYYAAALLSDPDSLTGTLGNNPYDNSPMFQGIALGDADPDRPQVKFSVVAPYGVDESPADATSFRYGVIDESSKINPNVLMQLDPTGTVLYNALMLLPNMTPDVADAIVDWIDPDDDPRPNGAENSYYMSLTPPYQCKNGPLDSLEELLYVRGVTWDLLFGTDRNRNGVVDPDEPDDGSGSTNNRGWSAYLTVYSRELNVDSTGAPRIYLNDPDTTTLYQNLTTAFGDPSMADFIMAYRFLGAYTPAPAAPAGGGAAGRGRGPTIPTIMTNSPSPITSNQFDMSGTAKQSIPSLFSLVSAKVAITKQGSVGAAATGGGATRGNPGRGGGGGGVAVTPTTMTIYSSPLANQSKLAELLPILLDKCTTRNLPELPARLNVNTASMETLAAMPGLTETDIQQIVGVRPPPGDGEWADPIYQTPAWLVTEAQLSPAKLSALEKYITAQTEVYRIQVLGYFDKGGPIARIEAVVDTNAGHPRFVYWRDLSELQKGFDFER